ncbi:MAG: glycosyltransferase [Deltaproteobacteria bacterium]|jgi:glycosyltransferase involved in cell wall biosynthesis
MKISVVIPAYNAESTIDQAVAQSLAQATGSLEVEVIVVDDGSSDGTAEVAESAGARVIRQDNGGPASARNAGWQSAKGRFICFTDADCIPSADWVLHLLEGFTDSQVGAVAGSYDIANSNSWLARWVHCEIMRRHDRMVGSVRAFGSYNVGIPRYVLEATAGFDSAYRSASGEDNDLSYRILKAGWQIAFRPQAKVAHFHPEKLWRYLKDQYRHGYWRAKLYKEHPDMVGGDDYTLLRDRIEPALILGIAGCAALTLLGITSLFWPLFIILLVYTCIHLSWPLSWWLGRGTIDALPYAGVTFMRGFARTLGLGVGILRFGLQLA